MSGILELLWEITLQSLVLLAAIWAMRTALSRLVSPGLRHALWGLLLLRLLLPVRIESPLSVMNAVRPATEAVRRFAEPAVQAPPSLLAQGSPFTPQEAGIGWPQALLLLWLAGAAVTITVMIAANARFHLQALKGARPLRLTRESLRAARLCEMRTAVPVYVSEHVPSPCLIGLLRPMILLTPESAAMPGRLHHVLLHELSHWKRRDNWTALLRNLACALHWFNPAVWAAARMSRRDCELACDAAALRALSVDEGLAYGETLLQLIRCRSAHMLHTATTMAAGKREMKERLRMIVRRPRMFALAAAAALLLSAALAIIACTGAAKGSTASPPTVNTPAPAMGSSPAASAAQPSPAQAVGMETAMPLPSATPAQTAASVGDILLWQQDGWSYLLESRQGEEIVTDNKSTTPGHRVGRLLRMRGDERQVLDELVSLQDGRAAVLPAGNRIVFHGYAGTKATDFKVAGTIVSINPDGSDRRVFEPKFHAARGLCVDGGYVYYEGWTNDGAFPRPVNRLNPDLTKNYKMVDIDGAFIAANGGYAYYVHKKGGSIYRVRLDWKSMPELYTESNVGPAFTVYQTGDNEYQLTDTGTGERFLLTVK